VTVGFLCALKFAFTLHYIAYRNTFHTYSGALQITELYCIVLYDKAMFLAA